MKTTIASYIRKTALQSKTDYWASKIKDNFDLSSELNPGVYDEHIILREVFNILKPVPPGLIKDCGIKNLLIRGDLGASKPYYPNHGYFVGDLVALNADIFYHPDLPDDFIDYRGYFLTRSQQTLLHELGHGYDEYHSNLSLQKPWLQLSGWSEKFKPGLKRLIINDERAPRVVGEWFYDIELENKPDRGFTRFYAKRNPWDDFADSFSFYIGDLKNKVPEKKNKYFDKLLKGYY